MNPVNDFITTRLANFTGSAGGPSLPPRLIGDIRVPIVRNLRVTKTTPILGGTEFTLSFSEPDENFTFIAGYNIYVVGLNSLAAPQGPFSAPGSPAILRLVTQNQTRVSFIVQTVLSSGLTSDLAFSPSCTGVTAPAVLQPDNLPPSGVSAGTYGSASAIPILTIDDKGLVTSASNSANILLAGLAGAGRIPFQGPTAGLVTSSADFTYVTDLLTAPKINRAAGANAGLVSVGGRLHTDLATAQNVSTGETLLNRYAMPANSLNENGQSVEIASAGIFAATGGNKRLRVYLGASVIFDTGLLPITTLSSWAFTTRIYRVNATSQKIITIFQASNTTPTNLTAYQTAAENLATGLNLDLTGQAGATGDISSDIYQIDWRP